MKFSTHVVSYGNEENTHMTGNNLIKVVLSQRRYLLNCTNAMVVCYNEHYQGQTRKFNKENIEKGNF